jgi:hypothetical protein
VGGRLAVAAFVLLGGLAGVALALPPGPPPKVAGTGVSPPPAWVEAGATQKWLAYSSYCWRTACVDFLPPTMRTDVPSLAVRRGRIATLHFRFLPKTVSVSMVKPAGKSVKLRPARIVSWQPRANGLAMVAVTAAGGDASYLVRIKLRRQMS